MRMERKVEARGNVGADGKEPLMFQDWNPINLLLYAIYQTANGNEIADTSDGFVVLCIMGALIVIFLVAWCIFIAARLSNIASSLAEIETTSSLRKPLDYGNEQAGTVAKGELSGASDSSKA